MFNSQIEQLPTLPHEVTVPLDDQDHEQILPTVHHKPDNNCHDQSAAGTESNFISNALVVSGQTTNRIQRKISPTNESAEQRDLPWYTKTENTNKLRLSWGSTQLANDIEKAIACDKTNARGDQKDTRRKKKGCRRMETGLQFISRFFHPISKTNILTLSGTNCGGTKRKSYEGGGNQPSKKEKLDGAKHS